MEIKGSQQHHVATPHHPEETLRVTKHKAVPERQKRGSPHAHKTCVYVCKRKNQAQGQPEREPDRGKGTGCHPQKVAAPNMTAPTSMASA